MTAMSNKSLASKPLTMRCTEIKGRTYCRARFASGSFYYEQKPDGDFKRFKVHGDDDRRLRRCIDEAIDTTTGGTK